MCTSNWTDPDQSFLPATHAELHACNLEQLLSSRCFHDAEGTTSFSCMRVHSHCGAPTSAGGAASGAGAAAAASASAAAFLAAASSNAFVCASTSAARSVDLFSMPSPRTNLSRVQGRISCHISLPNPSSWQALAQASWSAEQTHMRSLLQPPWLVHWHAHLIATRSSSVLQALVVD